MEAFDPNEHRARCEEYLNRFLQSHVRLVHAEPLTKSSRDVPWRLDVAAVEVPPEVVGATRSYVLRLAARDSEHEYHVLRAMEALPIPTPRVYGWDPLGQALGVPCFFCDFVAGESLLGPMLAREAWAEGLYIETVCALQAVTREQLATVAHRLGSGETAVDFLETAYEYFRAHPHLLADAVYERLTQTMPALPAVRFSNGDLWLDNLIVRDRQLAGIVDFEGAGFSDPIYEFLLPFFVAPELRGRGIEERYCQRMGYDPDTLPWYRALECFDTWHWVLLTGEPFVHHTAESLRAALERWLDEA